MITKNVLHTENFIIILNNIMSKTPISMDTLNGKNIGANFYNEFIFYNFGLDQLINNNQEKMS